MGAFGFFPGSRRIYEDKWIVIYRPIYEKIATFGLKNQFFYMISFDINGLDF